MIYASIWLGLQPKPIVELIAQTIRSSFVFSDYSREVFYNIN
jgi:hypothetical protein